MFVCAAGFVKVSECSVALLCDYGKGLLTGSRAQQFIRAARAAEKPVLVDPKGSDFRRYNGATVIKPNLRELAEATALSVTTEAAPAPCSDRDFVAVEQTPERRRQLRDAAPVVVAALGFCAQSVASRPARAPSR